MDHTKEPWEVGADKPPFYAGKTVIIGQMEGRPFILAQCNHNYDELSTANARRIVACVNACAGVEDPETAILNMRETIKIQTGKLIEYGDEKDRLVADRDRLQAELDAVFYLAVEKWFDDPEAELAKSNMSTMASHAREIALKAIEKAEADRDRWKALAVELKPIIEFAVDHVYPGTKEKRELEYALKRLQEAGE